MGQDSDYHSYLDLERRSGESQPDPHWMPLPPTSSLQHEPAPSTLAPPGYSQQPFLGSFQSPQSLTVPFYTFPSISGSMPTLMPASTSASYSLQPPQQSRMRPGSQVHSGDIKYLSSPPGITQFPIPSINQVQIPEPHLPPPTPTPIIALGQPGPSASTPTLARTRQASLLNVTTNGSTSPVITSQPSPTSIMSINFKGSRNAKCLPTNSDGRREWSTGLFGCIKENTCSECCLAWWCPCIVYGRNKKRLDHLSQRNTPDPMGSETICNGDCALHCCLTAACMFGWALEVPNRSVIRSRYSIKGSGLGDCCTAFWCSSCALAQESMEIGLEECSFPDVAVGNGRIMSERLQGQ